MVSTFRRLVLGLLCAYAIPCTLEAQQLQLTDWQTFSSLRSVRSASIDSEGRIWAATSGGVFVYDPATEAVSQFRNIGALLSLDVTSVMCDPATKKVYIGCLDGGFDVVNEDFTWKNVTDIRRATQYPRRRINDFVLRNTTLYLATDFGIVSYDTERGVFNETVDRIGTLQDKTPVNGITILHDTLWAATDSGVVAAPLDVTTLRLPSVWTVYGTAQGLGSARVSRIRSDGTTIVVTAGTSIQTLSNGSFQTLATAPAVINGLSVLDGVVYYSTISGVYTLSGEVPVVWPSELNGHITYRADGRTSFVGFVRDRSIAIGTAGPAQPVDVNSPISNQFVHLAIDNEGGLWAATDVDPPRTGVGITTFDGTRWTNITTTDNPELATNACYRVNAQPDGSVWIGTWGRGVVRAKKTETGIDLFRYDQNNSGLRGIASDPNYVLVGDVATDRNGTTWMVNEQAGSQILMSIPRDNPSAYRTYSNCADPRSNLFRSLAIDLAGGKWMASNAANGLLVINDRNTPEPSDDICNVVRSSNTQLPDNTVNIIRLDRNGALWIGTAKGVAVIASPGTATNTTVPFVRRITALSSVVVNDIHVDALNYKWVATTGGVFVLNEDGTEVLATISAAKTPLIDDNVRSVTVDERTGRAYFGTAVGLSSAATQSIRPLPSFAMTFHPQPYRPLSGAQLVIDGLASDADVRIMTPNGHLVAALQTRGRQALWDGRDTEGRMTPPGVYIVHTVSASTKESAVGKVVVTR
ncbi:MAG: hypothetical protein J0I17_03790 ['Candidatus Kapabacteria' thiocyanatum]|uniref:PorZ N-terminal beta-propeller domain-containing protein n=1 Tax=Candidatus Kapaibacterium thiocyanatum TaxID=1895771 RepID=A0A1M3KXU2_9BACT|nr:hypothetical protein ['Candidatus Kapabacteria' thiocyanatum]OJX57266.1 MAG: hypothetical protein BGO89_12320 ['Candidatus Kapabacteria' thiocyanatum]